MHTLLMAVNGPLEGQLVTDNWRGGELIPAANETCMSDEQMEVHHTRKGHIKLAIIILTRRL